MFAAAINQGRDGAVVDGVKAAALQRKSLIGEIPNWRRGIQFTLEPGLYRVLIGSLRNRLRLPGAVLHLCKPLLTLLRQQRLQIDCAVVEASAEVGHRGSEPEFQVAEPCFVPL